MSPDRVAGCKGSKGARADHIASLHVTVQLYAMFVGLDVQLLELTGNGLAESKKIEMESDGG